ncbi:MAG: methionine--tRNA ligase [Alphaproteobacteria bacterium CG11_big_fil_rev_8_21_14_0_20_44_7]|nr:MAG: methionine--tRNA ligase [Alphaproteobacteria bacterium CG11_big_fil_rev_8_21_14_0_20_44_7]
MEERKFYITTPIYYVNDRPHIGHAYTTIACDIMARFMRIDGAQVKFLTGTDEHGQKVEQSAAKNNTTPQEWADTNSQHFHDLLAALNITNDDFIRTTEERHKQGAQAFWKAIEKNGYIYKDSYSGWYSVRDEAYYQEAELIDGKAPTGADVEWVEEPSYFFKLSAFQDALLEFYEENPAFIAPEGRKNEVLSFVKGGLKDLSVSRTTFKWGIPVPGDEEHVMYVWLDALTNYITALGYPFKTDFWPASIHIVGKDILRFHAVYWPAFLMAAGVELPKRIFAHGWWTNEGQKISKSLGNVIDPFALAEEFGIDQVRYFLMREIPFGNDGDFSREKLIGRVNSELANNIGNLAQRVLSMINKNCGGVLKKNGFHEIDKKLLSFAFVHADKIRNEIVYHQHFSRALELIGQIASRANEYVDATEPWKLKKEDPERMETVLYTLAECLRRIGLLLQPFTPQAADKLLNQLAVAQEQRLFHMIGAGNALKPGTELPAPEGIFPRFEEE